VTSRPDIRASEQCLIKGVTHPGGIAEIDPTVTVNNERLGHHEVTPLQSPVWRVERILKE
jgi:hypothetical protein